MGLMSMFYPDRKRDLRPRYRGHCGCDSCVDRSHAYGEHWRHRTPVCTCCDCMAIAGENVPHTYSTYEHTHAATHTCAMTGCIRHRSDPVGARCPAPAADPPPRYSLGPSTTHKVDNCCGARYYATPLFPTKQPEHSACGSHHYAPQRPAPAPAPACACASHAAPHQNNELVRCHF
ncbi:hypothetical protein H4R18_002711 [Coemansia javaensis]|uniref:Uncharacterized protein n=1 Tax=Coemansia javaensis TaxID=2761396 RepID=A0A9W8LJM7_9FUNG|nr:hypothetical protein H4R18_002711 [Coemansia javaensis]